MKDIQSIRIEVKEGISARRVLYMEIRGQGAIPLTRTDQNLTPREIEQKAAELAYFLRVPIEVFWKMKFRMNAFLVRSKRDKTEKKQ